MKGYFCYNCMFFWSRGGFHKCPRCERDNKLASFIKLQSDKDTDWLLFLTSTEYKYIRDIIATQEIELDSLVDKKLNPHAKTIESLVKKLGINELKVKNL